MPACVSCSTELDPLWNYCVNCGTPVVRAESRQAEPRPAEPRPAESIPGAIRPEQPSVIAPSRTLPRSALLVIVLAVVGAVGSFFAAAAALR
ncbi:hypothetical protein GCM10007382_09490 [Salinibacterium xinjiangense]|uniref:Zinc-ribbon domain-containing protein n=1 Tax=Salinibacterium xinjiangense TaxID=386302 RepID=A0A2C8Z8T8_9MICO|nr:hypothetical protein [Salinibacterium xinjiangense]GGK91499.1 hypothetical protein GCM10007382_09490 [Salinibacterium xinjiangense]SOE60330.1 hypothetical protein SAMN06296378_1081 [Salinibacterium xinjiangense]